MITLGVNGWSGADHDAAAALVIDGSLVAAVEEERIVRARHAPGRRPLGAVAEVLAIAGITAADIDVVANGWWPDALGLPTGNEAEREAIRAGLATAGLELRPEARIEFVEHHVAHFWSSIPFIPDDLSRASIDGLVLDGAGESTSGALFRLQDGDLRRVWHLSYRSSLGLAYEVATRLLGFGPGEEGKTMGLAAYGRAGLRTLEPPPDVRFDGPLPTLGSRSELSGHLRAELGRGYRLLNRDASFNERADFAQAAQQMLEHRVLSYLDEIADPAGVLVLSGGTALNCTMNGEVARRCADLGITLVVPPAANDAGVAIGAAVAVSARQAECRNRLGAQLGPELLPGAIVDELHGNGAIVSAADPPTLAKRLQAGQLIGWVAGRAEFGPRALGSRAVLADPGPAAIRDLVNVKKGRESWRPLAPSVTSDGWSECFEGVPSPYMLVAARVRADRRRQLAGVTHVDNSVRPQVVPDDGTAYAELLASVGVQTGLPCVTCTSYNPAGQPIVHTVQDAHDAAIQMGLDAMAGDGWVVSL
ncbi:carbamoyltransferase C-terminal domain-containing protein [Kribbella sp. NPDC050820]|uniref:carbamoyltransferase C-terminal domain-containing protein n=1 Tax=Kribbella sp. NPDC050820 TaxID=3155408 RepID=UPI003406ED3A